MSDAAQVGGSDSERPARSRAGGTAYGAGWALAVVSGTFALVVELPYLPAGVPEGLPALGRGLVVLPFIVLLLLACWLVRRDGLLVGLAAGSLGLAALTAFRGGVPVFLLLAIALLACAAVSALLRWHQDQSGAGSAGTRVEA